MSCVLNYQPENIIYQSRFLPLSFRNRLFRIINLSLKTAIQYQRFLNDNQNLKYGNKYYLWKDFLNDYFYCTLHTLTNKQKLNNYLLGTCLFNSCNVYARIHLRYFSKKYEYVFWHEVAHLILHTNYDVSKELTINIEEFEADFFSYAMEFFIKDKIDIKQFDILLFKINQINVSEAINIDFSKSAFFENEYFKFN